MEVALAAVKLAHEAGGGGDDDEEIPEVGLRADQDGGRSGRPAGAPSGRPARPAGGPAARLFVGAGRGAGIRPQDLVGAITGESGLNGRDIGAIEITDRFSLVEVPESAADEVIAALRATTIKGRKATVRRDRDPVSQAGSSGTFGGTRWARPPRGAAGPAGAGGPRPARRRPRGGRGASARGPGRSSSSSGTRRRARRGCRAAAPSPASRSAVRAARRDRRCRAARWRRGPASTTDSTRRVLRVDAEQQVGPSIGQLRDAAVGVDHHRRRVAGVGPAHPGDAPVALVLVLLDAGDHGGGGRRRLQRLHRRVEAAQHVGRPGVGSARRCRAGGCGPGPSPRPPRCRGRRRRRSTSIVAPSRCRNASYQSPPTWRGLGGGLVADDDLHVVGLRRRGEQAALQPLGEVALLRGRAARCPAPGPARSATSWRACRGRRR